MIDKNNWSKIYRRAIANMELQSFEAYLDMMIDQINEESCNLIIEQPRYAHAVLVLANNDEPGELMAVNQFSLF